MDNMDTIGADNRWAITKTVGRSNLNLLGFGVAVGVGSIATYKLGEWTIGQVRERRADKAVRREAEKIVNDAADAAAEEAAKAAG